MFLLHSLLLPRPLSLSSPHSLFPCSVHSQLCGLVWLTSHRKVAAPEHVPDESPNPLTSTQLNSFRAYAQRPVAHRPNAPIRLTLLLSLSLSSILYLSNVKYLYSAFTKASFLLHSSLFFETVFRVYSVHLCSVHLCCSPERGKQRENRE